MSSNINSRLTKIERELDYSCLSGEQLRRLDVRRLTRAQIHQLDVLQLSDEQIYAIGFRAMTDGQLEALSKNCTPELGAVIESMTDEELRAVAEMRACVWYPGYKEDLTA